MTAEVAELAGSIRSNRAAGCRQDRVFFQNRGLISIADVEMLVKEVTGPGRGSDGGPYQRPFRPWSSRLAGHMPRPHHSRSDVPVTASTFRSRTGPTMPYMLRRVDVRPIICSTYPPVVQAFSSETSSRGVRQSLQIAMRGANRADSDPRGTTRANSSTSGRRRLLVRLCELIRTNTALLSAQDLRCATSSSSSTSHIFVVRCQSDRSLPGAAALMWRKTRTIRQSMSRRRSQSQLRFSLVERHRTARQLYRWSTRSRGFSEPETRNVKWLRHIANLACVLTSFLFRSGSVSVGDDENRRTDPPDIVSSRLTGSAGRGYGYKKHPSADLHRMLSRPSGFGWYCGGARSHIYREQGISSIDDRH